MSALLIIAIFFLILGFLIFSMAMSERRSIRMGLAIASFLWACTMFKMAGWVEGLNRNIWYSKAASGLIKASIEGLEDGRSDQVLKEMKIINENLKVTYESKGNFKDLADEASERLNDTKLTKLNQADPSQE